MVRKITFEASTGGCRLHYHLSPYSTGMLNNSHCMQQFAGSGNDFHEKLRVEKTECCDENRPNTGETGKHDNLIQRGNIADSVVEQEKRKQGADLGKCR